MLLDDGSPESDRYSLSADAFCLSRMSSIAKCLSLRCSDVRTSATPRDAQAIAGGRFCEEGALGGDTDRERGAQRTPTCEDG